MHKKAYICIVFLVAVIAITILEIYGCLDIFDNKLDGEFSVEDSSVFQIMANPDDIQEYVYLGNVDNIATLKRQAQKIWIEKYGLKVRFNQRPYRVFYDPSYDIYYITGTVKGALGGTANMFVKGKTGLILSVWHDK